MPLAAPMPGELPQGAPAERQPRGVAGRRCQHRRSEGEARKAHEVSRGSSSHRRRQMVCGEALGNKGARFGRMPSVPAKFNQRRRHIGQHRPEFAEMGPNLRSGSNFVAPFGQPLDNVGVRPDRREKLLDSFRVTLLCAVTGHSTAAAIKIHRSAARRRRSALVSRLESDRAESPDMGPPASSPVRPARELKIRIHCSTWRQLDRSSCTSEL